MSLVGCGVSTLTTGGIEADFESLEARCRRVADRLSSGGEVQVTSPGGTTLLASIDGRTGIGNTGMARYRGDVVGCPIIEAYIAPIEGSAEGILVIDGSTPFGLVASPIEIVIQSGRATDIRGGADAQRILEAIDGPGDPACRALAEVALGLNPLARVTGNLNEDEGAHRTGHFALGNNAHMGGTNWAPTHVDMVYLQPTVLLDGVVVMRDGELVD
jgi:leucyl aminopeptidase (aminopeptidase T)